MKLATEALEKIFERKVTFISRGISLGPMWQKWSYGEGGIKPQVPGM